MPMSSDAVEALITRRVCGRGAGVKCPPGLVVPATMVGDTRIPRLAMAAYTPAICTAVAATPWPNARVYRSFPHHFDGGGSWPWLVLGSGRPVGTPTPNFR